MGKTSQKLTIWVDPAWYTHPKVEMLKEKGHSVYVINTVEDSLPPDLILYPTAHQWTDDMWIYLESALKTARKRKYPRARKKA